MTSGNHVPSGLTGPVRHIGRNFVAYLALFLALGGTSLAAGKLLTGAEIQDDSLTGADIVESSLAKVPSSTNADQLGGTAAGAYLKAGTAAGPGGALTGAYPSPELAPGAAAANVWGKDKWAPAGATQRGYVRVEFDYWDGFAGDIDGTHSLSYPVPLGPGQEVVSHVIRNDEQTRVEGCGGTIAEPTAEPGHICIFWDPYGDGDKNEELNDLTGKAVDHSGGVIARYGRKLSYQCTECLTSNADVVWAMTPPR